MKGKPKSGFHKFMKLEQMLDLLDMQFVGNLHSGIDDTRNICRILMELKKDGATPVLGRGTEIFALKFGPAKGI